MGPALEDAAFWVSGKAHILNNLSPAVALLPTPNLADLGWKFLQFLV